MVKALRCGQASYLEPGEVWIKVDQVPSITHLSNKLHNPKEGAKSIAHPIK